jgi:hypothetical protein
MHPMGMRIGTGSCKSAHNSLPAKYYNRFIPISDENGTVEDVNDDFDDDVDDEHH